MVAVTTGKDNEGNKQRKKTEDIVFACEKTCLHITMEKCHNERDFNQVKHNA